MKPFEVFTPLSKFNLKNQLSWRDVQECLEVFSNISNCIIIDDTELHEEYSYVKNFFSEKLSVWNSRELPADKRWCEIFEFLNSINLPNTNFLKLVEFIFCLPGTNAPTERVFSTINNVWTADKTALTFPALKAIIVTKLNLFFTCSELYDRLLSDKDMLRAIHTSTKYKNYNNSIVID
jgi:hypothetical protein